jgi:glycosyltransferase involved in cell wall biosynthesis
MAARPLRAAWRRTDHPTIDWWTGHIDVVHGPNFVVPPSRRGAEIVTVHDLTCVRFPEMCTPDTLQIPALLRRAIARGAWVHTVSHAVAGEVIETFAVDAERVIVIPNGTVPMVEDAVISDLRPVGRTIAGAERYLLSLGTLEPRKDLPSLVAAFELLADTDPDLHLVIAGPDGWGSDRVVEAIARSPFRSRIMRTGWLTAADRDALIAGAEVFVYPSIYEGFGLPPLEALAFGTPVVATRVGALPEVLDDAAIWAEPADPTSLAGAIVTVLADPGGLDDLLTAGRRRVELHDWATSADALASLYRTAADSH